MPHMPLPRSTTDVKDLPHPKTSGAPSFSLITFAYNEEDFLESQLKRWANDFRALGLDFEIILVDDGSTDGTAEIIKRIKKEFPELVTTRHDRNRGVGEAVRTAITHLHKDYVFWNDIDGHFDVVDLAKVLPLLQHHDVVVAFKHDCSSDIKSYTRWLKSRVNYFLIKSLFISGIKDFQFVQFFPSVFLTKRIKLQSRSSFIPAECIFKAQACGLSVAQIELFYHSHYSKLRPGKCHDLRTIARSIKDIFLFWISWFFLLGRFRAKRRYSKNKHTHP
jgi:glycosyltransferase involved in cell wall biosynthesis